MLFRALIVGLLLALGEVVNGNVRVRVLSRKLKKKRAKTISFLTGIALIFAICWLTLPWIEPQSYQDCALIGFTWLVIMMSLELYFARAVFKLKWNKIFDDFNLKKGNLLGVGMIILFFSPTVVFGFRQ